MTTQDTAKKPTDYDLRALIETWEFWQLSQRIDIDTRRIASERATQIKMPTIIESLGELYDHHAAKEEHESVWRAAHSRVLQAEHAIGKLEEQIHAILPAGIWYRFGDTAYQHRGESLKAVPWTEAKNGKAT
jgi:hypothetical protein